MRELEPGAAGSPEGVPPGALDFRTCIQRLVALTPQEHHHEATELICTMLLSLLDSAARWYVPVRTTPLTPAQDETIIYY